MLRESLARDRTAFPLPRGVIVASLVSMLSTAAPESSAALYMTALVEVHDSAPAATGTAADTLASALHYSEMTGAPAMLATVADRIIPLTRIPPDPKERIRARVYSIMAEPGPLPESNPAIHGRYQRRA